ncbi:uncharacterized protein [Misgurnus anguillicaudatus]|uniref:uncharacterized protein n=1 Tax=Misgurnus anguillicaudatus TaxID=75329 RepID=UPI003CCF7675
MKQEEEESLETGGNQEPPNSKPCESKHKDFEDYDLPIITMADTILHLDVDCGFDNNNPLHNCDCQEILLTRGRDEVDCNFNQTLCKERNNLFLKSFLHGKYVTSSIKEICLEDTMSAKINIYYHAVPRKTRPGVPVLLNFTGTENFFACIKQGDERILSVTMYDLNKLRRISADDSEKWSLVFFMSQCLSGLYRFESALHSGWFIFSLDSNVMKLQRGNLCGDVPLNTFFSLIESETTKTISHCKR